MPKLLILSSNPRRDLNLDHEIRDLKDAIEKSYNRQKLEVEDALAVRVEDLQGLLFRHRPQIVHFCGHGSGQQGLVFEGNDGGERWVRAEALSDLFRLFAGNVNCVLLNACYSETQANAIVNHVDYVIGMNQEIRDDAAIAFSKGFYRALGYECSVEQAFEFGCNAIQLEISGSSKMRSAATEQQRKLEVMDAIQQTVIPEHLKPILKMKPTLAPNSRAKSTAPDQPLSQETRVAIQLDIDKSLSSADPKPSNQASAKTDQISRRSILQFTISSLSVGLLVLLGVSLYPGNPDTPTDTPTEQSYFKSCAAGTYNVFVASDLYDYYEARDKVRSLRDEFSQFQFELWETVASDGVSNRQFAVVAGHGLNLTDAKAFAEQLKSAGVAPDAYPHEQTETSDCNDISSVEPDLIAIID